MLAERAARNGWSIRALEAEIARPTIPRPKPPTPHPDHQAAAARLEEALTKATGCDARARPHRLGYQVILDQAAGERLIQFLDQPHAEAEYACHVAHLQSALCGSELGEGDVLVATMEQDCSDSSNPLGARP